MRAYGTYEDAEKVRERIAAELEGSGMHLGRHRAGADFAELRWPERVRDFFESAGEEGLGGRAVRPWSPDVHAGKGKEEG